MRVSQELAGMREKELRDLWCDGFIPEDFQVARQGSRISGRVWLAFGQERQESWRFVVNLGDASSRNAIHWSTMLPPDDVTGWLVLDFRSKFMMVNPHIAYADPKPAAT